MNSWAEALRLLRDCPLWTRMSILGDSEIPEGRASTKRSNPKTKNPHSPTRPHFESQARALVQFQLESQACRKRAQRMAFDNRFTGRKEKRLPVMMEVKLLPADGANAARRERAVVENISALGARVYASSPWQLGESVEVTPAAGEAPLRAEVVYCQKQTNGKFVVGLKFRRSPVPWSILEKVRKLVR